MLRPCDLGTCHVGQNGNNFEAYHIYAITKRPRVTIVPDSLQYHDGCLYGKLFYREHGQEKIVGFQTPRSEPDPTHWTIKESDYPHDMLLAVPPSQQGAVPFKPVALVAHALVGSPLDDLDLEIVYIGQSFGHDGHSSALDRLKNHSTLQRIQSDILAKEPDNEIILLLFKFQDPPMWFSHIIPPSWASTSNETDIDHYQRIIKNPPSERECILMTEAALIRYFQPSFNKIYKNSFPQADLACLRSCYDTDIHSLSVELSLGFECLRVFSGSASRAACHLVVNDLHEDEDRQAFFGLSSGPFY